MPRKPTKSKAAAKPALRSWRIVLIRKKGERLGTVEAPDAETGIRVAIEDFGIDNPHWQRRLAATPIE